MKHWVRLASYLYPASWRRRYAAEFDALLEEVDMGWRDGFDILKGAVTMQLTAWNFKSILLTFGLIGVAIAAAAAFSVDPVLAALAAGRLVSLCAFLVALGAVFWLTRLDGASARAGLWSVLLVAAAPVIGSFPVTVRPDTLASRSDPSAAPD